MFCFCFTYKTIEYFNLTLFDVDCILFYISIRWCYFNLYNKQVNKYSGYYPVSFLYANNFTLKCRYNDMV